jgi:hypothetical protein
MTSPSVQLYTATVRGVTWERIDVRYLTCDDPKYVWPGLACTEVSCLWLGFEA